MKAAVFPTVNHFSLIYMYTYRLLGYDVYYFKVSRSLKNSRLLRCGGFRPLSYEDRERDLESDFYSFMTDLKFRVFSECIKDTKVRSGLLDRLEINEMQAEKFDSGLLFLLQQDLKDFCESVPFALDLRNQYESVRIITGLKFWTRTARLSLENKLHITGSFLLCLYEAGLSAFQQLSSARPRIFKKRQNTPSGQPTRPQRNHSSRALFFPHQGIFYSKLYVFDHYYSSDEASAFHRSNLLHLDLYSDGVSLKDTYEYYAKHNIPHDRFNLSYDYGGTLSIWIRQILAHPLSYLRHRVSFLSFMFLIEVRIRAYLTSCQSYPDARIALIGYDILFPPLLSLVLSMKGIKTVAVQERFLSLWTRLYSLNFDIYFSQGNVIKSLINENRSLMPVDDIRTLGPVRIDLHYDAASYKNEYLDTAAKGKKIFLALDYHVSLTSEDNRINMVTWKTNLAFFHDLIALAEKFSNEIYIIIKSKQTLVMEVPYFNEALTKIKELSNIEYISDLEEFTPENILAASDAVIARATSLADEALAIGKPTIFYNRFGHPECLFDYSPYPEVLASDYNELKDRVSSILETGHFMSAEKVTAMKNDFYGNSYDGSCRRRLQVQLENILEKTLSRSPTPSAGQNNLPNDYPE